LEPLLCRLVHARAALAVISEPDVWDGLSSYKDFAVVYYNMDLRIGPFPFREGLV
jgi:hypothetical protein